MQLTVYKITNLINNKVYIGSTIHSIRTRFEEHVYESENRTKTYLHNAINKYGKINFKIEEIFKVFNESDLNYFEDLFIDVYNSINPLFGYNLVYSSRGVGSRPHISKMMKKEWEINREKRTKCLQSMPNNRGWDALIENNKTPERRKQQSELTKSRWENGEMDSVSAKMKEEWSDPETKAKRIESMIEGSKKKPIIAVNENNGGITKYKSVHEAIRAGFNVSSIYSCLNCIKSSAQGVVWLYDIGDEVDYVEIAKCKLGGEFLTPEVTKSMKSVDIKTGVTTIYTSFQMISAAGLNHKSVKRVLSGKRDTYNKCKWEYVI